MAAQRHEVPQTPGAGLAALGDRLAILAREVERETVATLDLYARPLDDRGSPVGPEVLVAQDATGNPSYGGADAMSVAHDSRRDRYLLAWLGHEPGMASEACQYPPGPGGLAPPPCRTRDHEVFVRILAPDGTPLGPPQRVSDTGPPDRPEFKAATASVAYDRRSDAFVLVHAAATRGEAFRGALVVRRLTPDGTPAGPARPLARGLGEDSQAPASYVVATRRGALAVFDWERRLYSAAIGRDGRPRRPRPLAGGVRTGGLVVSRDGRRALALYNLAKPGASSGFRVRALGTGGRPAGPPVGLSYELGYGGMVAAPARRGWRYAIAQRGDCPICTRLIVQRAGRDGRPRGRRRAATSGDESAGEPVMAPLGGGDALLGWTRPPSLGGPPLTAFTRRVG